MLLPKLRFTKNDEKSFKEKLRNLTESKNVVLANSDVQRVVDVLAQMIKSCSWDALNGNNFNVNRSRPKQKWFNKACAIKRERVYGLLKLYRKCNLTWVKDLYVSAQKEYKLLCEQTKSDFYNSIIEQFKMV